MSILFLRITEIYHPSKCLLLPGPGALILSCNISTSNCKEFQKNNSRGSQLTQIFRTSANKYFQKFKLRLYFCSNTKKRFFVATNHLLLWTSGKSFNFSFLVMLFPSDHEFQVILIPVIAWKSEQRNFCFVLAELHITGNRTQFYTTNLHAHCYLWCSQTGSGCSRLGVVVVVLLLLLQLL